MNGRCQSPKSNCCPVSQHLNRPAGNPPFELNILHYGDRSQPGWNHQALVRHQSIPGTGGRVYLLSSVSHPKKHPRSGIQKDLFRTHDLEVRQVISLVNVLELQQRQHVQVPKQPPRSQESAFPSLSGPFPTFGSGETHHNRGTAGFSHTLTMRGLHEPTCRLY